MKAHALPWARCRKASAIFVGKFDYFQGHGDLLSRLTTPKLFIATPAISIIN